MTLSKEMKSIAIILFLGALLCGCDRNSSSAEKISPTQTHGARVVGFRFALPGDDTPNIPIESGFTLIDHSGGLNQVLLNELKVEEAVLTAEQVDRLNAAVYGEHPSISAAACYDPHHIFVFYDDHEKVVSSIEICFSCLNIHTFPGLEENQWRHHDFRSLARLCDEIGIGIGSQTAEDLIEFWDESDRLGSETKKDNKSEQATPRKPSD